MRQPENLPSICRIERSTEQDIRKGITVENIVDDPADPAMEPLREKLLESLTAAHKELGIDVSPVLANLEYVGPVAFVKSAILGQRWSPYFGAVVAAGRPDLSVEYTVQRLVEKDKFWDLVLSGQLVSARYRLRLADQLRSVQMTLDSGQTGPELPIFVDGYWLCPAAKRAYWIERIFQTTLEDDFATLAALQELPDCATAEQTETQLLQAPWLEYFPTLHNHIMFCGHCRSARRTLLELHDRLADEELKLCKRHLEILNDQIRGAATFGRVRSGEQYRKARDWRAVVLADYLGLTGDVAKYCDQVQRAQPDFHPWLDLRNGKGYAKAVKFVQSLDEDLFTTALLAFEIQAQGFMIYYELTPFDGPLRIPSCGDIPEVKGLFRPELTWNTSSWRDWIKDEGWITGMVTSPVAANVTAADLLDMAADAAAFRYPPASLPGPAPHRFERARNPEQTARDAVGHAVFDRLCEEARNKIVDAEEYLLDAHWRDYASVVSYYAGAFETQIDQTILGPIRPSRKEKPLPTVSMPGLPLGQEDWPFEHDHPTLGQLAHRLSVGAPRFEARIKGIGIDPDQLLSAINEVNQQRVSASHGGVFKRLEAQQTRYRWLSTNRPDRPNIFERLLPRNMPGTGQQS